MMWHDWNSITAATAEMHCKLTVWNKVCDNTPILTLLNSDDHCNNINVVHECMTIKAVCVDYGEKTFLFSPKYVSNCTCHRLTVGLKFPVSIMPAYLSSDIISYVCPAHWICDFPRQASIFKWPYYILEKGIFWLGLLFVLGFFPFFFAGRVVVVLFFLKLDCFNTHFSWIVSLFQWFQYYWEADGSSLLVSCHPDRMMDVSTSKIFILFYIVRRCFLAPALKLTHILAYTLYGSSELCAFIRLNIAHTHSATTSRFVSDFFPLYLYIV